MKKHSYMPEDVCADEIHFDIDDGVLRNVRFEGGCNGNLQALSKLIDGMKVVDVLLKLRGIDCEGKGTSCADQLSKALEEAITTSA